MSKIMRGINKELIQEAIDFGWESLNYLSSEIFASISSGGIEVMLMTSGNVSIVDCQKDIKLSGDEIFENEILLDLVRCGDIYNSNEFIVDENNWFCIVIEKDGKPYSDFVYEDEHETVEDLVSFMEEQLNI